MPKKQCFKYEIGYQFSQYKVIDRIARPRNNGKNRYLYVLECLKCGAHIEREECYIGKDIRCHECTKRMEYSCFNIGDIVNNMIIVEKTPIINKTHNSIIRAYLCKCLVDGYTSVHTEHNLLKGKGCPVCAGIVVMCGVNDINTVAPWLGDLLENKEDGYKYSIGSKTKLRFKCPYCGTLTKPTNIYNVYHTGHMVCRKCGDNISMPEKIMYGILEKISIEFRYQKKFDWSCGRYYDFYIPSRNMIIETHGRQHYQDTIGSWDSLDKTHDNDIFKQQLAESNGVEQYVVIDCSISDSSILFDRCVQVLSEYFDTSGLEKNSIIIDSATSLCIRTGNIWNQGNYDISLIGRILHIGTNTIRRYLKILTQVGYLNVSYPIRNNKINGGK